MFDSCGKYFVIRTKIESSVPDQYYPNNIIRTSRKLMNYQYATGLQGSFRMRCNYGSVGTFSY